MSTLDTCEYSEYSSIQYSMSASIDLGKCTSTCTHEYILAIYLDSQEYTTTKLPIVKLTFELILACGFACLASPCQV
jgi:hypothetical protein